MKCPARSREVLTAGVQTASLSSGCSAAAPQPAGMLQNCSLPPKKYIFPEKLQPPPKETCRLLPKKNPCSLLPKKIPAASPQKNASSPKNCSLPPKKPKDSSPPKKTKDSTPKKKYLQPPPPPKKPLQPPQGCWMPELSLIHQTHPIVLLPPRCL